MNLELQIDYDIRRAMLDKAEMKLEALRQIKTSIQVEKAKEGKDLSDEQIIKIIQKLVSQSTESVTQYAQGGRIDLVDHELILSTVYKLYLPEQMTEEQITERAKQIISEIGATSVKDMGKVMGIANKEFVGKADSKMVGSIIKNLLS
jgi:uncharacterized protein YqeY